MSIAQNITSTTIMSCGLALGASTVAVGDMTGLSYEVIEANSVPGTYTVRVFAEMAAGDRLDAVFGNNEFQLNIDYLNGSSAYHNALGGPTSMSIHADSIGDNPSLEWDSYVTIGRLYASDNTMEDFAIDWSSWESGGNLFADNGVWWNLPTDPQGDEVNGRVLIAQLTQFNAAGDDVYFSAGFQWRNASGVTHQSGHSMLIDLPAPGALGLLAIAGLCSSGRRRRDTSLTATHHCA